ncbi:alanine dehydrogenase [Demequina sediminicola]|uniref:alanine dehydrogenase n=1 Tax=Demequina sediminicola TaxID=1095026 RepID=UPI0007822629|nr:alanine dehydrogenase [Demequina sediminicola]
MRIGVPTEVKNHETRVGLEPAAVARLVDGGHEVVVQSGAGDGALFHDREYADAGAIIGTREDAWGAAMVVKVKEPLPEEFPLLSDNILFTFLHLAANKPLAKALIAAGTTAFSYDTVQTGDGALPLLAPMSAIAGALAVVEGAHFLLGSVGGPGVLLGGAPGVPGARVVVIGVGSAGSAAIDQAVGAGAEVVVLDRAVDRLREAENRWGDAIRTVVSTPASVAEEVRAADLVIGAVLVPGRPAPVVIPHGLVQSMKPGAVIVDIAIDQGGCCEDSKATSHDDPVFSIGPATLYCVTNMPGAVGTTATAALNAHTVAYVQELAEGWERAISADDALARGLNVAGGVLRCAAVQESFPDLPAGPPGPALLSG